MEIFKGRYSDKFFEKHNLDFLRAVNCEVIMGVVGMV